MAKKNKKKRRNFIIIGVIIFLALASTLFFGLQECAICGTISFGGAPSELQIVVDDISKTTLSMHTIAPSNPTPYCDTAKQVVSGTTSSVNPSFRYYVNDDFVTPVWVQGQLKTENVQVTGITAVDAIDPNIIKTVVLENVFAECEIRPRCGNCALAEMECFYNFFVTTAEGGQSCFSGIDEGFITIDFLKSGVECTTTQTTLCEENEECVGNVCVLSQQPPAPQPIPPQNQTPPVVQNQTQPPQTSPPAIIGETIKNNQWIPYAVIFIIAFVLVLIIILKRRK